MILYPNDAPFSTTAIPRGADRFLTQEEADAANALYPVPPYGETYFDPDPPVVPPQVLFLRMTSLVQGLETQANLRNEDMDKIDVGDIMVIWPIDAYVAGVLDDIGVRPVKVVSRADEKVSFTFDSTGLDVSGVVLVGIKYNRGD